MGADFKEKSQRSFEKCWDKAAVIANTPDLFNKTAEHLARRFEAEAIGSSAITLGESVCVRVEEGRLVGRRGLTQVLIIPKPSTDLIQSITDGCNVARADVVAVDPISGIFEVTFTGADSR